MGPDLGTSVGRPEFERARGVLMELFGCDAEKALALIADAAETTGRAPEDIARLLVTIGSR